MMFCLFSSKGGLHVLSYSMGEFSWKEMGAELVSLMEVMWVLWSEGDCVKVMVHVFVLKHGIHLHQQMRLPSPTLDITCLSVSSPAHRSGM